MLDKGESVKLISDKLMTSDNSVTTHWKNNLTQKTKEDYKFFQLNFSLLFVLLRDFIMFNKLYL